MHKNRTIILFGVVCLKRKLLILVIIVILVILTLQISTYFYEKQLDTKTQLHLKMLNAIKHYNSIEATYSYQHSKTSRDEKEISFYFRQGLNPEVEMNNLMMDGNVLDYIKVRVDNLSLFSVEIMDDFLDNRNFKEGSKTLSHFLGFPQLNFWYPQENTYQTVPFIHYMNHNISLIAHPQYIAFYLRDHKNWEIERNINYLGRKASVIKGISTNHGGEHFELWVDRKTGILLKFFSRDSNDKLKQKISVSSIKVN